MAKTILKNALLLKILNSTSQMIALLDKEMSIIFGNEALLEVIKMTTDEIRNTPYWDLPIWTHSDELKNKILFSMEKIFLGETINFQTTHLIENKGLRDYDFTIEPILDEQGEIQYLLAYSHDITQYKNAEVALQRTEKQLKTFFEYSTDGNIINTIEEAIHWEEYMDMGKEKELLDYIVHNQKTRISNKEMTKLFSSNGSCPEDLTSVLFDSLEEQKEFLKRLIKNKVIHFEKEYPQNDKVFNCTYVAIYDSENRYYGHFGIHRDVTEQKKMEKNLIKLATKDSLTEVNIRRHYIDLAQKEISLTDENNKIAILMIDIDNFKSINDTFGHDIGDKALISMAKLCEETIGDKGHFGRMGGEEFSATIYSDGNDNIAIGMAERLRKAIEDMLVPIGNLSIFFTVSIGVTFVEGKGELEGALKRADMALYEAKQTGKNKVVVN
jgi:diguanylate cyclase (GGDEF)-like protein/PAS domain S-box-containing protein